jgi:hypothetical protein
MDLRRYLSDTVFVVDEFYENPSAVRAFALSVDFGLRQHGANFPGQESEQSFAATNIEAKFSEILGRKVSPFSESHIYGRFRYALANEMGATDVHIDDSDWTAVIYLTPCQKPSGGLTFYQHVATGLTSVPDRQMLKTLNYNSKVQFDSEVVYTDTKTPDAWRAVASIGYKFNRCVIFRGNQLFHGISSTFGTTLSDARLTQNFFLRDLSEAHSPTRR